MRRRPRTLPLAEQQRAHQAGDAGIDVNDGAAGVVEHVTQPRLP